MAVVYILVVVILGQQLHESPEGITTWGISINTDPPLKKSRILETLNISTDVDNMTNTESKLKNLRPLPFCNFSIRNPKVQKNLT